MAIVFEGIPVSNSKFLAATPVAAIPLTIKPFSEATLFKVCSIVVLPVPAKPSTPIYLLSELNIVSRLALCPGVNFLPLNCSS